MMRKLWLFLLMLLGGGCTQQGDANRDLLATLPQRYAQFDLSLAWEVKAIGGKTIVDGVVKNLRYAHMDGIEVWVTAVDEAGKTIVRAAGFVVPQQVRQDEIANFSVKLPAVLPPGTRLQFTYKYRGSDGGDGGTNWSQSFDSVVPPR